MKLLTVGDYAKAHNVSVQSVYQRIKRGTLEVEIQNGTKFIKVGKQDKDNEIQSDCKETIKAYKMLIKDQKKQIKELKKSKDENYHRLEKLFDRAVANLGFSPLIEAKHTDVIEVKEKKKKKKKKGKKSKRS